MACCQKSWEEVAIRKYKCNIFVIHVFIRVQYRFYFLTSACYVVWNWQRVPWLHILDYCRLDKRKTAKNYKSGQRIKLIISGMCAKLQTTWTNFWYVLIKVWLYTKKELEIYQHIFNCLSQCCNTLIHFSDWVHMLHEIQFFRGCGLVVPAIQWRWYQCLCTWSSVGPNRWQRVDDKGQSGTWSSKENCPG